MSCCLIFLTLRGLLVLTDEDAFLDVDLVVWRRAMELQVEVPTVGVALDFEGDVVVTDVDVFLAANPELNDDVALNCEGDVDETGDDVFLGAIDAVLTSSDGTDGDVVATSDVVLFNGDDVVVTGNNVGVTNDEGLRTGDVVVVVEDNTTETDDFGVTAGPKTDGTE